MRDKIRKLLREALGVPEGITDEAHRLYDQIMELYMNEDMDSNESEYKFTIDDTFNIGDYTITSVEFELNVHVVNQLKTPMILSFAFGNAHQVQVGRGVRLVNKLSDEVKLMSVVGVPNDEWTFKDIVNLFQDRKETVIASLTHELKHAYDAFKRPIQSPYKLSMYAAYAGTQLGLRPIDRFVSDLYFMHTIESLVRPSELSSLMKQKGVTQKEFLNFLTNNETYQRLKRISNFSVEGLKEELKEYIPKIDEIFQGLDISTDMSVDEKIEKMLEVTYLTMTNIKAQSIHRNLSNDFLEKITGTLRPEKREFFNRLLNRISRFPSYKEFFDYEEKMFKFVSRKVMKKLGKLYAMAKVEEGSILEWDLYQQVNKNKFDGFVKESKYFKLKNNKKQNNKN